MTSLHVVSNLVINGKYKFKYHQGQRPSFYLFVQKFLMKFFFYKKMCYNNSNNTKSRPTNDIYILHIFIHTNNTYNRLQTRILETFVSFNYDNIISFLHIIRNIYLFKQKNLVNIINFSLYNRHAFIMRSKFSNSTLLQLARDKIYVRFYYSHILSSFHLIKSKNLRNNTI